MSLVLQYSKYVYIEVKLTLRCHSASDGHIDTMYSSKMMSRFNLLMTVLTATVVGLSSGQGQGVPHWEDQESGVTVGMRAVSAVSETVAWASGQLGTVIRTVDGGATWEKVITTSDQLSEFHFFNSLPAGSD